MLLMLKGGVITVPWWAGLGGFGKTQRKGTDARCYNLRVREGNDSNLNEQLSWRGSNGLGENQSLWNWLPELGRQLTAACLFKTLNSMSKLMGSKVESAPGLPGGRWAADLNGASVCGRCRSSGALSAGWLFSSRTVSSP